MEIISKLDSKDWPKYKAIRLEALKNEPSSFSDSYTTRVQLPDEKWKEKLQKANNEEENVMFFAKEGDSIVGMIYAFWDGREKVQHVATISGVYVSPSYRRKGIGQLLMEAILEYLDKLPQIEKIELGVITTQIPALKMYEKFGFKHVGTWEKTLKVGEEYYDEYHMEKFKT